MTVGDLRKLIDDVPDDTPVFYEDPNFGGFWKNQDPDFTLQTAAPIMILIRVPYWEEVL